MGKHWTSRFGPRFGSSTPCVGRAHGLRSIPAVLNPADQPITTLLSLPLAGAGYSQMEHPVLLPSRAAHASGFGVDYSRLEGPWLCGMFQNRIPQGAAKAQRLIDGVLA